MLGPEGAPGKGPAPSPRVSTIQELRCPLAAAIFDRQSVAVRPFVRTPIAQRLGERSRNTPRSAISRTNQLGSATHLTNRANPGGRPTQRRATGLLQRHLVKLESNLEAERRRAPDRV